MQKRAWRVLAGEAPAPWVPGGNARRGRRAETQVQHVFTVFTATFNRAHVIVGDRFPRRITDSDPLDVQYRLKVRGEKCRPRSRLGRRLREDLA